MSTERAYLDHNATSPLRPQAVDAMCEVLADTGNASSVHSEGRRARGRIEAARDRVAALVNAAPASVIFTSGGTEANNLAIRGIVESGRVGRVLVGATEHPSVLETCRALSCPVVEVAVTGDGVVDLDALEATLDHSKDPALVSIMLANNETGALQPVSDIARMTRERGGIVHTDAVQGVGRLDVDFRGLGVDLMSLSAHKLGGPPGMGALIARDGLRLSAQCLGGGQELKRRGGTENLPAIAGFGVAAECAANNAAERSAAGDLKDRLERLVAERLPDAVVFSAATPRLPNTTCLAVPGVQAEYLVIALDLEGFAVSSGSACSSGKVARSHVLEAMDVDPDLAECAIRVSTGWTTTGEDIERFADALERCCNRRRERTPGSSVGHETQTVRMSA